MTGKTLTGGWRLPIVFLCQLLIFNSVWVQPAAAQGGLQIVVVEGQGARNVTSQIAARPIVVRIQDANNRPVAGATVIFSAPQSGASGDFANDARDVQVITGPEGIANAGPFHPNATEGPYQITIRAQFERQTAAANILQTNVASDSGVVRGHKKLIAILAIAGAAAGAAVAAHSSGGSSSSTPSGPTISFGGSAVGAPK